MHCIDDVFDCKAILKLLRFQNLRIIWLEFIWVPVNERGPLKGSKLTQEWVPSVMWS